MSDPIQCIDPRTGEPSGTVPTTPVEALPELARRARVAGQEWHALGLKRRKWAMADLHQAFLKRAEDVASVLALECGRPAGEAWTSEIVANHDLFTYWLGHIDDLLASYPIDLNPLNYPRKSGRIVLQPKGLLGLITPWNLPVAIPLRALVPALLAGNSVLWKPSEYTPRTGALLAELMAGVLPEGVVTLVQGAAPQGQALVPLVDGVFFTGSVRTGRAVATLAAEHLLPCALELGGKDAAVVLPDAELDRAAAGITWAAMAFAGQNCAAVERCYVHESVYASFVDKVVERVRKLRPMLDVGPLVTEAQLQIVKRHVADAVDKGARVLVGGGAPGPGWYHEPTVLTEVRDDMLLMRQETFGPVLPILPFRDLDEVVERVNGTEYGLTTSVWSRDLDKAEAMAGSFACGVVTVNNHSFTGALPNATWGGVHSSGHGVTNSRFALYEMVRPTTVLVDALGGDKEMWWYPYNDALVSVTRGLILLSARGGNKLQGVRAALTGFTKRWKDS